jgi:hypothetical protein
LNALTSFGRFLYEFLVGDDPLVAVGVIVVIAAVALLEHAGLAGFWIVPPAVVGMLALSLRRATRDA